MLRLLASVTALLAVQAGYAAGERYTSTDIRTDIVGRRIFLAAPFGGEFPLNYRRNGRVDGSGEALGLGRFTKPMDTGRWWIDTDLLCQKFRTWYDGRSMCFELYRVDDRRLKWIRNDGKSGTARIGPRL